jgi:methylthioribulose-1-phosphate dehydratase
MPMSTPSLICELARQFYDLGWVTGTGGGICIREGERVTVAPSGVQKERMTPEQMFVLSIDGTVLERPADPDLRPSECSSLFLTAIRLRDAGAVIHTHSIHAVVASLLFDREFVISEIEMIKGIEGMGYHDRLVVPIIENTPRECDLAASLEAAIVAYPETQAVLVRRHGVYVWGRDWVRAKTQAECYDYLFRAAAEMRRFGIPTAAPKGVSDARLSPRPTDSYARR